MLGFCSGFASQMSFIKDAKIKHAQKKENKIKFLYSFPDKLVFLLHFTKLFYIAEQLTLGNHERRWIHLERIHTTKYPSLHEDWTWPYYNLHLSFGIRTLINNIQLWTGSIWRPFHYQYYSSSVFPDSTITQDITKLAILTENSLEARFKTTNSNFRTTDSNLRSSSTLSKISISKFDVAVLA